MKSLIVAFVGILVVASGCVSGPPAADAEALPLPPPPPTHVLLDALEPDGLVAPVFAATTLLPTIRGGEPSVWAHTDGTLYLAFPGCATGEKCANGPIYKSTDRGASWDRVVKLENGSLAKGNPPANGDNDVAVDAAGAVYASNLGAGIQIHRSADGGPDWEYLGDLVPRGHWADRQWVAAADAGHVIVTWMGGEGDARKVAVRTTTDGGKEWTKIEYLGATIGWLGPVQFDASGRLAFIPFTESTIDVGANSLFVGEPFKLKVARTQDGGRSWDVVDTGVQVQAARTGAQWSGVIMAPALDVTGDGTIVYAWSEETTDPAHAAGLGAAVKFIASKDGGGTWSKPVLVSDRKSAIMPWVTGGAGDRFAVTYFDGDTQLDTDYTGPWDVTAAVVDGAGTVSPTIVRTIVEKNVHQGGLCGRGGMCGLTASDRSFLDFFESDLLPDGSLVVVYPKDTIDTPYTGSRNPIELRFGLQTGGTPLLDRALADGPGDA